MQLYAFLLFWMCVSISGGQNHGGSNPCSDGELPCEDELQCIDSSRWCDKNDNCSDGSDEKFCQNSGFFSRGSAAKCPKDKYFGCYDGPCVPLVAVCDGYSHCKDGSDEKEECSDSSEDTSTPKPRESKPAQSITESGEDVSEPPHPIEHTESEDPLGEAWTTAAPKTEKGDSFFEPDPTSGETSSEESNQSNATESDESSGDLGHDSNSSPQISELKKLTNQQLGSPASSATKLLITASSHRLAETAVSQRSVTDALTQRPVTDALNKRPTTRAFTQGPATDPITQRPVTGALFYTSPSTPSYYDLRRAAESEKSRHGSRFRARNQTTQPGYDNFEVERFRRSSYTSQGSYPFIEGKGRTVSYTSEPSYAYQTSETGQLPQYNGYHSVETVPRINYEPHVPFYNSHHNVRDSVGPNSLYYPNPRMPENHNYWPQWNGNDAHTVRLPRRFVCSPVHQPMNHLLDSQVGRDRPRTVLPPFHFGQNYAESMGYEYGQSVERAKNWIMEKRDHLYEWGDDTPRAVVALSLIENSFSPEDPERDLVIKRLTTHLGIKLLRQRRSTTNQLSDTTLASYINALVATCQDPRQFMDQDLVEMLQDRATNGFRSVATINPMVYITLCLVGADIEHSDIHILTTLVRLETADENIRDKQILATTALACIQQQKRYRDTLTPALETAVGMIFHHRANDDGSFGGVYRTALAAQALMSMNFTEPWDARNTLDFLANQQKDDGSFGGMLATYLTVPVLSGRSLLHLRNTSCDPVSPPSAPGLNMDDIINAPGPKKQVLYTLKVDNPPESSVSISMSMPKGFSIFDAMKMAEYMNPRFKFSYDEHSNFIDMYSISDIPNDSERGYRWRLYIIQANIAHPFLDLRQEIFNPNLRLLFPNDCEELIFWYLRDV